MGGTSRSSALAGLELRQRQVLRFAATFCNERGHLPAASDIAHGCGLGSTSTVLRVMRELEAMGLIERDPQYPRLGRVTAELTACRPELELAMVEVAIHESRGNLDSLREALRWAPDAEAIGFVHREGVQRAMLLRAYEDARRRLRSAGVVLTADVQKLVDGRPDAIRTRHALIEGWESYCVYSAAITVMARLYTTTLEQVGLALLEPVWASESLVYDFEHRLDRDVAAAYVRAAPAAAAPIVAQLLDDTSGLFREIACTYPELTVPEVRDGPRMLAALQRSAAPGSVTPDP
jgi:hypothetical protein